MITWGQCTLEIAPIPMGARSGPGRRARSRRSCADLADDVNDESSRRTARNSLPMNYFSRFHVHAGSRMVDAGAQTCTWSPVPRPVHRDRDPGPESRDARQFSLSARWGTLASSRTRAVAREAAGPKWRRRRGCSACGAFQPLEGRSRSVRFRRHRSYKGCAVSMLKGKTNIEPASEVVRSSRPP